jgi:hypothetical protein
MLKLLLKKSLVLLFFSLLVNSSFSQPPDQIKGVTVSGIEGIKKSASEIIAHEREHPLPPNFVATLRPELDGPTPIGQNPEAKPVSKFGALVGGTTTTTATSTSTTQANFSNFLAIWGSYANVAGRESPYTPPDNCGDVGFTQVVATANCRMKAFPKPSVTGTAATTPTGSSTTTLPPDLNVDLNSFFANSSLGISGISDPHVRFDRLTGRWFIVAIDINHNTNNYCCIGVSDGEHLTASSTFKIFYFNISQTGGSSQDFWDYPTLGVDKNSLYIGGNMFKSGRTFSGCNMWVVNKASLINGTKATVTGFSHGSFKSDIYTPQGVHNDDPSATYGYFVGASQTYYSKLNIKRVSYSATGVPSISGDMPLTTATTYTPKTVPTLGGTSIDGGDRRLYAAMIKRNKITGVANLWIAQGTRLSSSGVGGSTGDRDGALWLEIGSLESSPTILQGATLYDGTNPTSSANYYTYPTIALSGQGHSIMGFTSAGPAKYAQAAVAGRYRSDAAATFKAATDFTASTSTYNPGASRWGDYTQTVVDPLDDMTMWTFSEYAATTNSWGVRAAQLKAPPPATPVLSAPPACGPSTVTINGTSVDNSEFFDPGNDGGGPGFTRLQLSVTGPSTIATSNVIFVNPTQIQADFNLPDGTSAGDYTLTVTNPDGQTAFATFHLNGCPAPPVTSSSPVTSMEISTELKNNRITRVYPNPTSSSVTFDFISKANQKITVEIFDLYGRKMMSEGLNVNSGVNQRQISLSRLLAGTYIIEFKDVDNKTIDKVKVLKN